MGKVITVISGKGGSGKTVIAVNLGAALAMMGKNVLLLDLNPGFRSMDFCVQMQDEIVYDFEDVLNGVCKIRQAVIPVDNFENLSIMSCSQNPDKADFDGSRTASLFEILKSVFDYIIVDTPSGSAELTREGLRNSDKAIIITTPEYASVRANHTACSEAISSGVTDIDLIINRIRPEYLNSEYYPTVKETASSLKARLVGIIQEDDNIYISYNRGVPIVTQKKSYLSENFINIIERMNN